MRKILFLAFLCIVGLASPAFATPYFVDTASSGGDGTTTATSGTHAAFATIAAVNAASFNPGDSISFKCGCVWREQLNIPSSGSTGAGNTITIGSYGTGAQPLILATQNAMGAAGDWSNGGSGNIWSKTWPTASLLATMPEQVTNGGFTSDTSWTGLDSGGWEWDGTNFAADKYAAGTGWLQQNVSAVAGYHYNVAFTVSNLSGGTFTVKCGNSASVTISSSGTYQLHLVASTTGANLIFTPQSAALFEITNVSVKRTYEPYLMLFNDTSMGTSAPTPIAPYQFYYNTGTSQLQVYATSNPTSYYSNIEAGYTDNCINTNGQSYLTINNIHCRGGNPQPLITGGGGIWVNSGSYVTVENCTVDYCYQYCIEATGVSNVSIDNNAISNTIGNPPAYSYGDAIHIRPNSSNTVNSQNVNVTRNTVTGVIGRDGIVLIGLSYGTIGGPGMGNNMTPSACLSGIHIEPESGETVSNVVISYNTVAYPNGGISAVADGTGVASYITIDHNSVDVQGGTLGNYPGIFIGNSVTGTNYCRWNTVFSSTSYGPCTFSLINAACAASPGTPTLEVAYNFTSNSAYTYGNLAINGCGTVNAHHNIITNSGIAALGCAATGTYYIYNNVLYNYTTYGMYFSNAAFTATVKNNICVATFGSSTSAKHIEDVGTTNHVTTNYDYFWPMGTTYTWGGSNYTFSGYRGSPALQEQYGNEANPLFTNASGSYTQASDFKLQATSPCITTGTLTNIPYAWLDFLGCAMKNPPSVGAYEPGGFRLIPVIGSGS